MDLTTGRAAFDRYLTDHYDSVKGMSSRFAAGISGHLLMHQTTIGIHGQIGEIGTFEGRYFIALAHALEPGEVAHGFDSFDWPDEGIKDRCQANVLRHGIKENAFRLHHFNTSALTAADFVRLTGGNLRFIHVDGDHTHGSLIHDMTIALAALHPKGLMVLDDILHPGYPFLVLTVAEFLKAHPELCVMCIIDREDIVAAPKFVLCHVEAVPLYRDELLNHFARFVYPMGADALGHDCVVLTPKPRLAEI